MARRSKWANSRVAQTNNTQTFQLMSERSCVGFQKQTVLLSVLQRFAGWEHDSQLAVVFVGWKLNLYFHYLRIERNCPNTAVTVTMAPPFLVWPPRPSFFRRPPGTVTWSSGWNLSLTNRDNPSRTSYVISRQRWRGRNIFSLEPLTHWILWRASNTKSILGFHCSRSDDCWR